MINNYQDWGKRRKYDVKIKQMEVLKNDLMHNK